MTSLSSQGKKHILFHILPLAQFYKLIYEFLCKITNDKAKKYGREISAVVLYYSFPWLHSG